MGRTVSPEPMWGGTTKWSTSGMTGTTPAEVPMESTSVATFILKIDSVSLLTSLLGIPEMFYFSEWEALSTRILSKTVGAFPICKSISNDHSISLLLFYVFIVLIRINAGYIKSINFDKFIVIIRYK